MFKINKFIRFFVVINAFIFGSVQGEGVFTPPTEKQIAMFPIAEMEKSLSIRKVQILNKKVISQIAESESAGILGYHGDSLEFMIYQDIIRHVMEQIVEIPVRKDFYFLAVPLDPSLDIQTKERLAAIFSSSSQPERALYETTFPLNFSIWDNANRIGLNCIENFVKNESVKPLGYKKRLVWLFKTLGINEKEINVLFSTATAHLNSNTGVILQIFDGSDYAFSKKIAYPSYPNGFISDNATVDEYFLNESFMPPFPHEVRLLLNNAETLNPKNPLKMVRHCPGVSSSSMKSYENSLLKRIKNLSFSKSSRSAYRKELQSVWGN